ncbi:MAG: hypothetical protein ACI9RO_000956 [Alteromonas macleodii]|jgi:hypothetical protein
MWAHVFFVVLFLHSANNSDLMLTFAFRSLEIGGMM